VPFLSVPGNIVYNNSDDMYTCMCMYRERKRETRNSRREKSQSFRWSFRVNKQETREDIEGNVFYWFKKKSRLLLLQILLGQNELERSTVTTDLGSKNWTKLHTHIFWQRLEGNSWQDAIMPDFETHHFTSPFLLGLTDLFLYSS